MSHARTGKVIPYDTSIKRLWKLSLWSPLVYIIRYQVTIRIIWSPLWYFDIYIYMQYIYNVYHCWSILQFGSVAVRCCITDNHGQILRGWLWGIRCNQGRSSGDGYSHDQFSILSSIFYTYACTCVKNNTSYLEHRSSCVLKKNLCALNFKPCHHEA